MDSEIVDESNEHMPPISKENENENDNNDRTSKRPWATTSEEKLKELGQ